MTWISTVAKYGFDPHNRDVIEEEVAAIPTDIIHVGWSEKEVAHAICCEDVPGEWTVERYTVKVCTDSTILAPVEPETIRFGSLWCSHDNGGLRAIKARMPCTDPLLSRDGRYCTEKSKSATRTTPRASRPVYGGGSYGGRSVN